MKRLICTIALAMFAISCFQSPAPVQAQQTKKKRVLAIGETKGFHHDATSTALQMVYNLGVETGLWETYIQTSCEFITKKKLTGNKKNIDAFDAVFFYTTGELGMDEEQKAALLSFVKDDGKGFIGGHTAIDTFYQWPEYGEMVGGYFDRHPWNTFDAPILVEDRDNPIVSHMPRAFTINDEIYQVKNYSRDRVRVLARLDESKLDFTKQGINRTDKDFAVAWIKNYGKGRVFYSTFGHHDQALNRPDIRKLYTEAIKWALKLTEADATPRPRPSN